MKRITVLTVGALVFVFGSSTRPSITGLDHVAVASELSSAGSSQQQSTTQSQRALLDRYCATCHNERTKTGGLALDTLDVGNVGENAEIWEEVVRKLRGGLMPPPGRPRPDGTAYEDFVSWLEESLDRAAAQHPNVGRTETLHRLNRAEYQNAVRDLFALEVDIAELLPADDASYGFDNMAGVLKLNQALMERYLSAAMKISRIAVGRAPTVPLGDTFGVPSDVSQYRQVEGLPFGTRGGTLTRYNFRQDGDYEITVELICTTELDTRCNGSIGFADAHELLVLVDGEVVKSFTLLPRQLDISYPDTVADDWFDAEERWSVRLPIKAGLREVGVTFVARPAVEYVRPGYRKRFEKPYRYYADAMWIPFPFVDNVRISGPFASTGAGDTLSRRAIFSCTPQKAVDELPCARSILSRLARLAYRRPVTEEDSEELLAFYRQGRTEQDGTFESGIELAIRRLLVSSQFLYRVEREPENVAPASNYAISDLELASRLSFFLWSSIPDDELLTVASQGTLTNPQILAKQVQRMVADRRSHALVENFFGQWLKLRHVEMLRPSEQLYPDFDANLRQAFRSETELFLEHIIREDRSVLEMLTADYTFANERLARHYGIPHVRGVEFRHVRYPDDRRRGLLGHGSILTQTSHAIRTSPVFRGKWVLENLLGTPPPAPPANVPPFEEAEIGAKQVLSMRERMAAHRSNPVCASCHAMIDPAGFALENFNAVGKWRDVDKSFNPVDASGVLPDGTQFSNLAEFRQALLRHPERFVTNLTEKLLVYALGRGPEYYDQPTVRQIVREARGTNYRFSSVISGIVNSSAFQMRRSTSVPREVASRR